MSKNTQTLLLVAAVGLAVWYFLGSSSAAAIPQNATIQLQSNTGMPTGVITYAQAGSNPGIGQAFIYQGTTYLLAQGSGGYIGVQQS